MATGKMHLVELSASDRNTVIAAATTLCRAFSDDPLIKWLRPGLLPWATPEPETMVWQQRRVQRTCIENRVFVIRDAIPKKRQGDDQHAGLAAVGFICPPTTSWSRRLLTLHSWLRLCITDYFRPVDSGADMNRVQTMFMHHASEEQALRASYNRPLWYIEVVAVDPAYQGMKFGSRILEHMIQLCPLGDPIYLECTDKANVGFYEKFGFKVVKELALEDSTKLGDKVTLWQMVRA